MDKEKCPQCSADLPESAKFCPECGAAASLETSANPAAMKKAVIPFRDTLIVTGVVAVITIGYFVFSNPQPKPVPQGQMPAGHGDMEGEGMVMPEIPADYDGLVAAGDQYMNQNNFPIAAECYKRALAIDGSSPDVRSDFGSCLYGMGLVDRALEEFRTVKKDYPLHSVSLFNIGVVFYSQNTPDSARFYFNKYLELDPSGKAAEQARNFLKELGV
jgi:tetratricopeptide (TPR) repeat protein